MANTNTLDARRATLARFAHNATVPTQSVPSEIRDALQDRGLLAEHVGGQLSATPLAWGYVAAPSTFAG